MGTECPLHSQGGRRQGGGSGSLGRVPLLAAVWASAQPRSSPVPQVGRPCDTPASGLRGTAPRYSARVWTDELPTPAKARRLCVPGRRCGNHGDCSEPRHGREELLCRSTPVRELVSCCFTDDLPLATWCSHRDAGPGVTAPRLEGAGGRQCPACTPPGAATDLQAFQTEGDVLQALGPGRDTS